MDIPDRVCMDIPFDIFFEYHTQDGIYREYPDDAIQLPPLF